MVRVILVDDHTVVRKGLRALIDDAPDMEVLAEAENGREGVQLVQESAPDVVLMDVSMPGLNGVEATRQIVKDSPRTRVVALSMHAESEFVARMLEAGGAGYVLKDCEPEELLEAIRTVAKGETYLTPRAAGIIVDQFVRTRTNAAPSVESELTPREREVLQLIAEGIHTKAIAARLDVSPKTILTHRRNIMGKLDIHSVAELTKYAVQKGLTTLDA